MWFNLTIPDFFAGLFLALCSFIFLRRQIIGFFDPLLLQITLIAFSAGVFFVSIPAGPHYNSAIILLLAYFLALFCAGFLKPPPVGMLRISISNSLQVYAAWSFFIIMLMVLVFNYIFGYSPILHGGGHASRVLVSQNNRILEYCGRLLPFVALFLVTSDRKDVRILSLSSVVLGVLIFILQGNRAGIIYPIIVFLNFIFIKYLFFSEISIDEFIRKVKKVLFFTGLPVFIFLPFYVSTISDIPASDVYLLVLNRLFLSLDGLFIVGWSSYDFSNSGLDPVVMYFQPIFKLFSITNGSYNSVMDYVNYIENGLIPGEYNGPTDNIFVEAIVFFDELFIGFGVVFCATFLPLFIRSRLMHAKKAGLLGIALSSMFFINPLGIVLLGYLFFVDAIFLLFIMLAIFVPYFILLYASKSLSAKSMEST